MSECAPESETSESILQHSQITIAGGKSYIIGLSALGIVIGFLAGASQTPIVSTILPLLFGLIGGASGLFLGNAPIDSRVAQARLSLIGKSLAGFCIGILVALAYGITVRTGNLPIPYYGLPNNSPIPTEAMSTTEIAIRALGLRNALTKLGATHDEIDHIMRDTFVTHHDFSTSSLDALLKDIGEVSEVAPAPHAPQQTGKEGGGPAHEFAPPLPPPPPVLPK